MKTPSFMAQYQKVLIHLTNEYLSLVNEQYTQAILTNANSELMRNNLIEHVCFILAKLEFFHKNKIGRVL